MKTSKQNHWHVRRRLLTVGVVIAGVVLLAASARAQTEPEAPRIPEKLYNGYQFSLFGGMNLLYVNGEYNGECPCEFLGDETSFNTFYGVSVNIPIFADASIYLRAGRNRTSTEWFTGRSDSLRSTAGIGLVGSTMTLDYDLMHVDLLLRLFGHIDGERVYLGPSFGFVREKKVRIYDSELATGRNYLIEDGDLQVDHDLRVSFVIGAEYAFIPLKNLYVIPAIEVDYAFSKILQDRSTRPNFSLRPTFYRFYVTVAYQLF
ncbi:MAG: hypothetical protein JXA28_10845 [Bacteroidetes bacterium]|nr:hypothetical protein [Bacteroidota bacterium]